MSTKARRRRVAKRRRASRVEAKRTHGLRTAIGLAHSRGGHVSYQDIRYVRDDISTEWQQMRQDIAQEAAELRRLTR